MLPVSTAGCPDSVTLFCTAIERATYGIHKLFRTGDVPTSLTSTVLAVVDGFFGLCGSKRLGGDIHRYLPPFPPVPNRTFVVSVNVKPKQRTKQALRWIYCQQGPPGRTIIYVKTSSAPRDVLMLLVYLTKINILIIPSEQVCARMSEQPSVRSFRHIYNH